MFPIGKPDRRAYSGLISFGENIINITGGSVQSARNYQTSTINISGGTVVETRNHDSSTVNISGGYVNFAEGYETGTTNISGGTVDFAGADFNSTFNISGGSAAGVGGMDHGTINISGGSVKVVAGQLALSGDFGSGHTIINISGGNVGGIDDSNPDTGSVGIYLFSGTLNLYGSGFVLNDIFPDVIGGVGGNYSTLTGTLLDGTAINTTFFLAYGMTYETRGGGTQANPILPDSNRDSVFTFSGVPSGAWFDPPLVGAYNFAMMDGNLFTSILDFPSSIGDADGLFTVSVGGVALGQFSSGTAVNFADFGFAGGVSGFTVSGIDPTVDSGNPNAFPIKLAFSSPFASFTMTGITGAAATEPATLLLVLPVLGFAALCRKRA